MAHETPSTEQQISRASAQRQAWYKLSMSLMVGAAILFAAMWLAILTCTFLLYRWLFRIDRDQIEGRKVPFQRGL